MLSGGGGGGAPSRLSSTHLPRSTGERSRGVGRNCQNRPLRHDAAALLAIELDALKLLAVHSLDAVIARKRAVDEREAAVDEIEDAAILRASPRR